MKYAVDAFKLLKNGQAIPDLDQNTFYGYELIEGAFVESVQVPGFRCMVSGPMQDGDPLDEDATIAVVLLFEHGTYAGNTKVVSATGTWKQTTFTPNELKVMIPILGLYGFSFSELTTKNFTKEYVRPSRLRTKSGEKINETI